MKDECMVRLCLVSCRVPSREKILGGVWQAQVHLKESGVEWLQKAICIEMGWCLTSQKAGCPLASWWHRWPRASTVRSVGFPGGADDKEPACQHRRCKSCWFNPWVRKIPGVGNGNSLQYPCLENLMDRGAWQAIVHGVIKIQTD